MIKAMKGVCIFLVVFFQLFLSISCQSETSTTDTSTSSTSQTSSTSGSSSTSKTDPAPIDKCKWSEASYDYNIYIRVIKTTLDDLPISFVCWEKAKLTEFIFQNVPGCQLAISNKNGLTCATCMPGYTEKNGACNKASQEAPSTEKSSTELPKA